jgi:hypothetical protein
MMGLAVPACSYGGNHVAYGEYRSGSSKSMAEIIFFMVVRTAIGYVQKALILRVKEPKREASGSRPLHVWFKGSLANSNLSGATRYSIP